MPTGPKIVWITTPIRPVPVDYPPVGSLSILSALDRAGYDNWEFYNIDLLRPGFDEAVAHIVAAAPDILAVSSVVSTAYEYTKNITLAVKKALPKTTILMGGNLGTSAEILLKRTGIDFVCTGEGEKTMLDFVGVYKPGAAKENYGAVKGLAFLDSSGKFVLTPYADALKAEELYDIDWTILEDLGQVGYFIMPAWKSPKLGVTDREDPEIMEIKRSGRKCALINSCKGCVARCTFCHRWDKGIRYIPVPVLMKRIDWLIEKHNVGFFRMGDENFGTDKKWLGEFCDEMKKRKVLWRVGGMRVNCIDPSWIQRMREAGCVTIFYGMESGSQKMLDIMEKKTTVQQNRDAIKWMVEKHVSTIIQFIVGMPGESSETVKESCEYLAYAARLSPDWDPNNVSVNFAQALPGTPLYEVGRQRGLIGQSLDDEEGYLIKISDRDARDGETAINFTDSPRLVLERWHYDLQSAGRFAYIEKFGIDAYMQILSKSALFEETADTGYFAAPARLNEEGVKYEEEPGFIPESSAVTDKLHGKKEKAKFSMQNFPSLPYLVLSRQFFLIPMLYPRIFMRLRFLSMGIVFINTARKYGLRAMPGIVSEYARWRMKTLRHGEKSSIPYISLRKYLADDKTNAIKTDNPAMEPLRAGR